MNNLHELLTFWVENYKRGFVSQGTYQCCLYIVGLIKKNTENMYIAVFDDVYVNALIVRLFNKGYSKSILYKVKSVISRAYAVAIKKGFTCTNPCEDTVIPISAPVKGVYALSTDEQQRVEMACNACKLGHLVIFMLKTGLRRSELLDLKWSDFDESKKCIFIRKSKTKTGVRKIPLIPRTVEIILNQPRINDYIFNNTKNMPLTDSSMKKLYEKIQHITGIKAFTNHVCRHTFATRLIERGANPKSVSELLGHKDVAFTLRTYTTIDYGHLQKEVMLLE